MISNAELSHMKTLDYRNLRPTKRTSRLLPFKGAGWGRGIDNPGVHDRSLCQELTTDREAFRERGLQGKPHYFFLGRRGSGRTTNIINYGAGI